MRIVARGIGVVALAVGLAACDATRTTSTEPAPYEGAKISLTGTSSIAVPGLDGRLVEKATHEWALDGVVTEGIAEAETAPASRSAEVKGGMPVLALSDNHVLARGRPNQRQFVSAKSRSGEAEDFVMVTGDEGGPAKTIVHFANHQIDQSYSFQWQRVRGGWKARSFAVTQFKNGKVMAQVRSKTAAPGKISGMVAADDPCWTDPTCDPGGVIPTGIPGGTWGDQER